METVFLAILILSMAFALASGYPVAFALPGSAILSIGLAALTGYFLEGNTDAYFSHGGPTQWLNAGVTNFRGIYWEVERDTLIAIPLFVFMGIMLERSKVAEDLLLTMAQLFGPIPGGLGIAVVFVGALLAATTGIVGATVIAMGLISLPVMLRNNYSRSLATGTIAASGTLGQIIPPSIVLIILADQLSNATDQASTLRTTEYKQATGQFTMPTEFDLTSTSAGDMFVGALLPGLVLVGLYMIYILILALIRPGTAPPVPFGGRYDWRFLQRVFVALVPPLTLILLVLGSIILGIATVNQAGAIGAVGALIMAGYRLRIGEKGAFTPGLLAIASLLAIGFLLYFFDINIKNIKTGTDQLAVALAAIATVVFLASVLWSAWRAYKIDDTLGGVMIETAKTTSLVFIILLGAAMLTAAFRAFGGEEEVREFLTGLPGGFFTKFAVVMAVIFILGFFLDFIEIAVVVVPIIAPILLADTSANVTAVWLGVMIGVNMQTSFLTPPFGFALFYLRGVAPPEVRTTQIYLGVVPFIFLQLVGLGIVGVFPALVNYLPNRVYLTAETAPPPKNPRLQLCLEEYVFAHYDANQDRLRQGIAAARRLDLSYLPAPRRRVFAESLDAAEATFAHVAKVREAEAQVAALRPSYKPVHREVRGLQANIRRLDAERKAIETQARRGSDGADPRTAAAVRAEIDSLVRERQALGARIPSDWKETEKRFRTLTDAERRARLAYRRNVDGAYEAVSTLLAVVGDTARLAALEGAVVGLRSAIADAAPKQAMEEIRTVERSIGKIAGAGQIRSKLSRARRELRRRTPDRAKAMRAFDQAVEIFRAELAWRSRAATELAPGLAAYDLAIRHTIGVRQQDRLTSEQAAALSGCLANHRDISLNF